MSLPICASYTERLQELLELLSEHPDAFETDEADRQKLLQLSRKGAAALETPYEAIIRIGFGPLSLVAARVGEEHKIFQTLLSSDTPFDVATLAEKSGLDMQFTQTLLDFLCTQNMAREISSNQYIRAKLTGLLAGSRDALVHCHDNCMPAYGGLNAFLSETQPSQQKTSFHVGHRTNLDFYSWLQNNPVQATAFHNFMEMQFSSLPSWLDIVSFEKEFAASTSGKDILFVDVGGGNGSQCQALAKRLPKLFPQGEKGRIILQDRPDVLLKALSVPSMETMAYDYFTPQPVRGAKVYYFRQILHNNKDSDCIKILQAQIPALDENSVIVIDEKVLSDHVNGSDAGQVFQSEYTAALNLAMKAMFNGIERREKHWRQLLDQAGLVVKDIRIFTPFEDAVIIAAKK